MSAFLDAPIPTELSTQEFSLRPITPADTEKDYAAVMEARAHLRLWEQSTWPTDDFTVEDNRVDVVDMAERHAARRAFSYTVLDPAGTVCLGCVYIFPTTATFLARSAITAPGDDAGHAWEDLDAVVYFWMRASCMGVGMDERLLSELRTWLAGEWAFARRGFATSETFTQQVDLLERAGLTPRFAVQEPEKEGRGLVFA